MRTGIKDLLKQRDISLQEAGEPVGVTRQTVAAWIRGEGGRTLRSRRKMRAFCNALKVNVCALFPDVQEFREGVDGAA